MPAPTTTTSTFLTRLANAASGRTVTAAPAAAPSRRRRRVIRAGMRASSHEREVVQPRRARTALQTDDGPRHRSDRRGRPRRRPRTVRVDEARVADAARPDGRIGARADLVRAGAARRRGRRAGVGADDGAGLEAPPRLDRAP